VRGGDFVPITAQGGVSFFIGNNPRADGHTASLPGTRWDPRGGYEDAVIAAEGAAGRSLGPSEVYRFYVANGLRYIRSAPDGAIGLFFRKFYFFCAGGERSSNKNIYFWWRLAGMGKIPLPGFWLIAPLGFFGAAVLWRHRRKLSLLYLFVASVALSLVTFFVTAESRVTVVPVLTIFAAYGLYRLWIGFQRKQMGSLGLLSILLACFLFVDSDFFEFRGNRTGADATSHYVLGNFYLAKGDEGSAIAEYEKAIVIHTRYPSEAYRAVSRNVDYNLGRLYYEKGLRTRAVKALERVGGSDKYALYAKQLLADCYMRSDRVSEAIRAYNSILKLVPNDQSARLGLARAHRMIGDVKRSEDILRSIISGSRAKDGLVYLELAQTLESKGDFPGAIQSYLSAANDINTQGHAYAGLGRLYQKLGDEEKALEYLQQAQRLFPTEPTLQDEIKSLLSTQ
jgi:tetratricopeptide (TPR) repeat protein